MFYSLNNQVCIQNQHETLYSHGIGENREHLRAVYFVYSERRNIENRTRLPRMGSRYKLSCKFISIFVPFESKLND